MAYQEREPESFPCLAEGCSGDVWVTDQRHLHWYHNHSVGGERPGGPYQRCTTCEAKIRTATVPCLNNDTGVPGDRGCIGDGQMCLYDQNPRAAVWYVMHGCNEPPGMYPYCDRCRDGVVFTGPCRNRGCRGDGTVRCPGHLKKVLVDRAEREGESSFWPPRNCQPCREFIKSLGDLALTCSCCKRPWSWKRGRQIMLLLNEPRSAFVPPELCDGCLGLGDDERKALRRRALGEEKQRAVRRALREAVKTADGREALRETSRALFLEAARTMFQAPDRHAVDERVKVAALTRIARLGGDQATEEFRTALDAVGGEGGIAAMLANGAITDAQARKVVRALAKLAAGGQFPAAFAERMKVDGGIPMDTGLAKTSSRVPRIAQAAAYEIHAAAAIADNSAFSYPFSKAEIASFHYRFQHNRYGSASAKRSYEGDIVVQHRTLLGGYGPTTFVDFKHSTTGKPVVTKDELERIFHGLERGEIDRAVIVSNAPLTSTSAITDVNHRIEALNRERHYGDDIDPIRTFIQPW